MSTHTPRSTAEHTGTVTRRRADPTRGGAEQRQRARWRLRRWLRFARRRGTRWAGVVGGLVSPSGWLVLASGVLGLVLGAGAGWVEGWFLAVLAGALLLLAVPFLLGGNAVTIRIRVDRDRVVAGGRAAAALTVENRARRAALPAVAELPVGEALLELGIPLIRGGATAELPVAIAAPRRGVIRVGPVTVTRRDPLGLLRRAVTWRERFRLFVHPVTARLPQHSSGLVRDLEGQPGRRLTDADLSFHAVREYVRGDSLRHVHWRSTAKAGTLMVRQDEESQLARVAVLFDAVRSSYADDAEFELAVSAAASLSAQAVRDGRERFVGSAWVPGTALARIDGLEELPSRALTPLLDAWAALEALPEGLGVEVLAKRLAEVRRDLSVVFVVTGALPELARLRRSAIAFPPDVAVIAVRCERLAEPAAQRLGAFTVLTVGALGDLPRLLARGGTR